MLGAWLINGAKSWLTVAFPSAWLYFLGALFILVTLFLPGGLVSFAPRLAKLLAPVLAKMQAKAEARNAAKTTAPDTAKGQT